ncbi:TPA: hypothetical protein L9M06_005185 [Klebsiella quasipneumoniae subsp. quasipneumoniae]|nr:hypothetical protein [Klebsiella quasipneumoniae subsp. quasipneumoniae]HBR1670122.1 hypothetical protein [Klebsiella quasipneumoniae subsp. quasipneumoniae]
MKPPYDKVTKPVNPLKRRRSSHYIDDLLAQCDFSQPRSAEDEHWMASPPKGKELL